MAPNELDTLLQYRIVVSPSPVCRPGTNRVTKLRWVPSVEHREQGEVWSGDSTSDHSTAYEVAEKEFGIIVEAAYRNVYAEWYDDLPEPERQELKAADEADRTR